MEQTGFGGDVGEGAVAIVFEEMRSGSCPAGKLRAQPFTKIGQPAVVVVIVESDTTAVVSRILVFVLAAENGFGVEAGFARDIQEVTPKSFAEQRWRIVQRLCLRETKTTTSLAASGRATFPAEHERRAAERLEKRARVEGKRSDTFRCEARARIRRLPL